MRDKPPDLNLSIGNSNIDRSHVQRFLGLFIDDKVTFAEHTKRISTKLSQGVGVMRKIKGMVPSAVLKQLFYTFIYSKFTYAITCYGSAYQNQTQRIKNLIDKALKLVLNRPTITPEICKNERLFNFDMAYEYFCSINMYRILRLNSHDSLAMKVFSYQTNHSYETRAVRNEELTLPHLIRSKCQRSFLYNGIKIWNNIPLQIRNVHENLNSF